MSYSFGIIAAFITLACWTIGTFAFTHASQLASPKSVNRVRLLLATVLLSIITLFFTQNLFTQPTFQEWLWLGSSGIVGLTIGDYFAFTAYRLLGSAKASLFNTFAPFAALLLGIVLLSETISVIGLFGMAISVTGLLWFIRVNQKNTTHTPTEKQNLKTGIVYAILAGICQGLGIVLAKKGLMIQHTDTDLTAVHATWIRMFTATAITYTIGIFTTNLKTEFKEIVFKSQNIQPVLIGTLFGPVIGVSMSLLAASIIEVSLAQTIFSLLPITVMLSAFIIGKEKIEPTSLIAALISVAGVFVLVWRNEIGAMLNSHNNF